MRARYAIRVVIRQACSLPNELAGAMATDRSNLLGPRSEAVFSIDDDLDYGDLGVSNGLI